jgi:molybdopterin converting factor small subunit
MRIAVKLFAAGRELAGASVAYVNVGPSPTAGEVRQALVEQHAPLGALAARSLIAVNAEYADDATRVAASDEVALIPPVSGG